MNLRVVAAAALLVLGAGAVGFAVFQPSLGAGASDDYLTATASVGDVVDEAVANGTVAATRVYGLAFGSDPYIVDGSSDNAGSGTTWTVEEVNVAVGEMVSAGDILATAESSKAQRDLELAQANLDAAQARYDEDTGGTSESDREAAQIAVDQAEQQFESAQQSRDETARQNEIKLQQAKDAVSDAKDKLADDRDDDAPDSVISADKDAVASAQDALALERIQVESSNRQAQEQVKSAQLSLDSATNNFDSQTSPATDEQIATDRANLLQAQQQLDDAQALLDGAVLKAPVDGTVLAVNVVVGLTTSGGDAIQVMSDALQVTADFSESDLPTLALGQPATVTVSATDSEISGSVSAIAQSSTSDGASSVVSYAVTITLTDAPDAVRPGMSAEVAVTIAEARDVVAIPSTALTGGGGNYSVRVIDSTRTVTVRQVQVGLISTSMAEIVSGLQAGEEVVTGTTSSLTTNGGGGPFVLPGGGGFQNAPAPGGGPTVVQNGPD